jgi:SAM-dependent methyltransferase
MLGHLEPFGSAYGLDIATEALHFCKSRGRDRLTQGMTTALPFEDRTFDLVTALDILEHVSDDISALKELGRVLRPMGRILITVPAYHFLWGRQDEIALHLRRYTAGELRTKVQAAGLVAKKLTYFNTLLFPVIAGVRLGRQLLPRSNDRELVSDFTMTRPGRANDLLARIFSLESGLVNRVALPFGVSILAMASKPAASGR